MDNKSFAHKSDPSNADEANESRPKKRRAPNRKYNASYIQFGFITDDGDECRPLPKCVICSEVLANESMKPSKLRRHLETKHPHLADQPKEYFINILQMHPRLKPVVKISTTIAEQQMLKASYLVAQRIVQNKLPHTIAQELILPAAVDLCSAILGEESTNALKAVPLSSDTIHHRISEMSDDIKDQLISKVQSSGVFSLILDESTDIGKSMTQLLVYVRLLEDDDIREEFLTYHETIYLTTCDTIIEILDSNMKNQGLEWSNCCSISTDGSSISTGRKSKFASLIKRRNPVINITYQLLQRRAILTQEMQPVLHDVLNTVVSVVECLQSSQDAYLCKELSNEMGSEHVILITSTEDRWLADGNVVQRVLVLREQLKDSLTTQKSNLAKYFHDHVWLAKLAYLADIFNHVNALTVSTEGEDANIFVLSDKITAFRKKLRAWKQRVSNNIITMFPLLEDVLGCMGTVCLADIREIISEHLAALDECYSHYLPNVAGNEHEWIRDPFHTEIEEIDCLATDEKDQLIDLSCDGNLKKLFDVLPLASFWIRTKSVYPRLYSTAMKTLIQFYNARVCKVGFSSLTAIKSRTAYLSTKGVESQLRFELTTFAPRIDDLCSKDQLPKDWSTVFEYFVASGCEHAA